MLTSKEQTEYLIHQVVLAMQEHSRLARESEALAIARQAALERAEAAIAALDEVTNARR